MKSTIILMFSFLLLSCGNSAKTVSDIDAAKAIQLISNATVGHTMANNSRSTLRINRFNALTDLRTQSESSKYIEGTLSYNYVKPQNRFDNDRETPRVKFIYNRIDGVWIMNVVETGSAWNYYKKPVYDFLNSLYIDGGK